MAELDEHYKQKYLKYKAKYMELKLYEQQGGLLDSGFGIVFTSKDNAAKLREAITAGKIGNKGDIANLLDRKAYIIFDGKKPAELLESTSRIMKDKLAAAATTVASATKTGAAIAWDATKTGASMAASAASAAAIATATGAIALKDAGVNKYKEYNENKEKEAATKAEFEKFKTQSATNDVPSVAASVPSVPSVTTSVSKLVGGADLPLTIATLDNKSFDRANEAHKKHIAAAVAAALELPVDNIATVVLKFKIFGSPELRD